MRRTTLLLLSALVASCTDSPADDIGADGTLDPLPPPGKEDGQYHAGLSTSADTSKTDVWKVVNQWEDKDTPAAQQAGMAWPANSGLTWDQKFGKWVESFEWTPSVDGYNTTYKLTTPWGKTLPAPQLECAETALFLRVAFASWYGLPLQFEAQDGHGTTIYFGHFGVRTQAGKYSGMPDFAVQYKDYTGTDTSTSWPQDATLRQRIIHGGDDTQTELAQGAVFGTYMDEIMLNKRVGYFTTIVLDYLGSANLADTANTYNLQPEAMLPGDLLLERWQKSGIGHTLVVKEVTPLTSATVDVTLVSGSMPRRQGAKETGQSAKETFTGQYTGGPGMNSDGDAYVKLGGGLKRFRVAKAVNGYWTNTWMNGDEAHWINSTDYATLSARPARFDSLLGQVPLDQQRTELLARIADARHHLSQYPASCSAREERELAFKDLYDVEYQLSQKGTVQVDQEQRTLEDYVFGELDYSHSKTCCWDSTTAAMHDIVMAAARDEQAQATANQTCVAPTVFAADSSGSYQMWAGYAAAHGQSAAWLAYHDDEDCTQRMVTTDTIVDVSSTETAFCSLAPPPAM